MTTPPPTEPESAGADEAARETAAPLQAALTPKTPWDRFWQTASSGLFFMVVGTLFLIAATLTIGSVHAGMTFIFVVVGVAILLYGTGTQATGTLDSSASDSKFKLSMAGGAGALAFAAAAGIVFFQNEINQAFREETRFLNVSIRVLTGGSADLQNFAVFGEVDGEPVAMMKDNKDSVVAIVPYTLRDRKKRLVLRAVWADPEPAPSIVNPTVESEPIDIDLTTREADAGGLAHLELEHSLKLIRENIDVGAPQVPAGEAEADEPEPAPPPISIQPQ